MVDPLGGAPSSSTPSEPPTGLLTSASTLAVVGCLLVVAVGLLFAMLALPWVASGFLFYYSAQAAPAARVYQNAPACAADGSTGRPCVRLIHGRVASVRMERSIRTASVIYRFTIEHANGIESASVSDFVLVQPPSWPGVGQSVDATLYEGKVTEIGYDGSQIDTTANPVVHEHDLIIGGLIALGFGIALDGGIFISMRRRTKASGPAAS
jgi:hypothetical protein